jgi:hypothetical protein
MGFPLGPMIGQVTAPPAAPSLVSVTASLQQQGTETGGVCDPETPYIWRTAWTVANTQAGYTVSLDDGFEAGNPPSQSEWAMGLALDASPQDHDFLGRYADAGGDGYYYRATARIIRTSDSAVVSTMASNVVGPELVSVCVARP